ncbi:hypothetical protein OEZ85_012920 [Tetradesmus obliquus]|uniref:tRNA (cytosine(38)-C(5))-methyltransferase n=1 Tax=Tetradesmus obliquus TaxID=3088 RepID=A0ABY8U437_TETOB|nr:hypothetical protein OEZ85_012920 [Tetradesmus obliquus]
MGLTALEFYSGIGGMHYALQLAAPAAAVLDAFDINHSANRCYEHNFGKAPKQVDIEHMTAAQLDAYAADLWLLAPPCQPFTRQGAQLGAQDNRSRSFLNLLDRIPAMRSPPRFLLLENVVGFEASDMQQLLMQCLAGAGYHAAEFMMTPLQYGIPYSRPRYFCLASKQPLPVALPASAQPCQCTPSLLLQLKQQQADTQTLTAAAQQVMASHVMYVQSIGEYLWGAQPAQQQQQQQQQQGQHLHSHSPQLQQQQQSVAASDCSRRPQPAAAIAPDLLAEMWVPDAVLARHAEVVDVVSSASCSCNCFTKAYGKLARGAGSLLATVEDPGSVDPRWRLLGGTGSLVYEGYPKCPEAASSSCCRPTAFSTTSSSGSSGTGAPLRAFDRESLAAAWQQLRPRYFTPAEIARLHSFPQQFGFPGDMTPRQCYKLLGNSLSVAVVADLLRFVLLSGSPDASAVDA